MALLGYPASASMLTSTSPLSYSQFFFHVRGEKEDCVKVMTPFKWEYRGGEEMKCTRKCQLCTISEGVANARREHTHFHLRKKIRHFPSFPFCQIDFVNNSISGFSNLTINDFIHVNRASRYLCVIINKWRKIGEREELATCSMFHVEAWHVHNFDDRASERERKFPHYVKAPRIHARKAPHLFSQPEKASAEYCELCQESDGRQEKWKKISQQKKNFFHPPKKKRKLRISSRLSLACCVVCTILFIQQKSRA